MGLPDSSVLSGSDLGLCSLLGFFRCRRYGSLPIAALREGHVAGYPVGIGGFAHVQGGNGKLFDFNKLQGHDFVLSCIVDAGLHPETAPLWGGLGLHSLSRRAIDQAFPCDGGLGVVTGQIAGDGVIIDVELQVLGDVAEQAFLDKLLGKRAQGFDVVEIDAVMIGQT